MVYVLDASTSPYRNAMIYSVLFSLPFLLTFIVTQLVFFGWAPKQEAGKGTSHSPLRCSVVSVLRNALIFACTVTYVHSQPANTSYVNE